MDWTEARTEVDELLSAAQDLIGGEWESLDGGAQPCAGAGDARSHLLRLGVAVDEPHQQAIIDSVVESWRSAGWDPTVSRLDPINGIVVTQVRYPSSGHGEDGLYLQLSISASASSVEGLSRCVPGDVNEINRELAGE